MSMASQVFEACGYPKAECVAEWRHCHTVAMWQGWYTIPPGWEGVALEYRLTGGIKHRLPAGSRVRVVKPHCREAGHGPIVEVEL